VIMGAADRRRQRRLQVPAPPAGASTFHGEPLVQ
jgi:hypothetical protein